MAQTQQRSSTQLFIDDDLNVRTKKVFNLGQGDGPGEAVEWQQWQDSIIGLGNSLHSPVADLTAAKAVLSDNRLDKMLMHIETIGLYRYDAESILDSNDDGIIRPTDIVSDVTPGRWVRMSSALNTHNAMTNKQGGSAANSGEYYHLTSAELIKLTTGFDAAVVAAAPPETKSTIADIITGSTTDTTVIGNDYIPFVDSSSTSAIKKITFTSLLSYFQAKINYVTENIANKDITSGYVGLTAFKINFKNAAGSITSFFTNSNTTARTYTYPNKDGIVAMTDDILPNETSETIGNIIVSSGIETTINDADYTDFSDTSASGILKRITWANVWKLIFTKITGDVTISSTGVSAIGVNKVANSQIEKAPGLTLKGNNIGSTANLTDLSVAQIKTMLNLVTGNQSLRSYNNPFSTGLVNGVNKTYVWTGINALADTQQIYLNGFLQNPGSDNDYIVTSQNPLTISFISAPLNTSGFTDVILADFSV